MKLIHRFAYYFGGFSIGIIVLFVFLGGKDTSCDYGPTARTLKNIRLKERVFSEDAMTYMKTYQIDTASVSWLLVQGKVLFSESNTKLDSCKQYIIKGDIGDRIHKMRVENCEEIATVMSFEYVNK